MPTSRTRDDFKAFLDWTAAKGLMPTATVQARKAAANMILDILSEEEAQDVTSLDLAEVMHRFQNLKGKNYTPASMATYQSRLGKALDDFRSYAENPMGFKPAGQRRPSGNGREATKTKKSPAPTAPPPPATHHPISQPSSPVEMPSTHIIPIPIRSDLVVRVQGLPFDLTAAEAEKIANVIKAMAMV